MKNRKAFTLIELLIVIAIIGLLAGIISVSLKVSRDKARVAAAKQFSSNIKHAIGSFLIGEWNFDDSTLNDSAGKNNAWYAGGGTPVFVNGAVSGKAVSLDGTHLVRVDDSPSLKSNSGALTVEFWMYIKGTPDTVYVLNNEPTTNSFTCFRNGGTGIYCLIYGSSTSRSAIFSYSNVFTLNQWFHIALTYDGKSSSSAKMFINGKEYAPTWNLLQATGDAVGQIYGVYLGGDMATDFNGIVDDLRIYDSYYTP